MDNRSFFNRFEFKHFSDHVSSKYVHPSVSVYLLNIRTDIICCVYEILLICFMCAVHNVAVDIEITIFSGGTGPKIH